MLIVSISFQRSVTSTSWSCSIKNKVQRCPATVRQNGDTFTAGPHAHIHPADPGNLSRYLLAASLKAKARTDLHQSAMKLVEEALLELPEGAHCHPDPALLKRKANRARQALRLADSRELNNKVATTDLAVIHHINDLMQKRCNSSASAMELHLIRIKPAISYQWLSARVQ